MPSNSYNTDYEVNAIGRPFPSAYNPIGPCISSVIDCRTGHDNPLDGFVIEEGTIPAALAPLFQLMLDMLPGSTPPKDASLLTRTRHAFARYGSRLLGPYLKKGAVERTQVYLVMSHDSMCLRTKASSSAILGADSFSQAIRQCCT
jgi:hypothetical protein